MRYHYIFLAWFVFAPIIVLSQDDFQVSSFSSVFIAQDIPNANITGMAQDPRGFVWIATRNGLFRYDGITFRSFRNAPGAEKKISFNVISNMHLVKDTFLVLEGLRELNVLNIYSEELTYQSPADKVLAQSVHFEDQWFFLFEDHAYNTYLYEFAQEGHLKPVPMRLPDDMRIHYACYNGAGFLYFFDWRGHFWMLDTKEPVAPKRLDSLQFMGRRKLYMPSLFCDSNQQVWAMDNANNGLRRAFRWSNEQGFEYQFDLSNNLTLIQGNNPDLLWLYDLDRSVLSQMNLSSGDSYDLFKTHVPLKNISSVFKDRQGNIWIGSQFNPDQGILLIHPHHDGFKTFLNQPGKESSLGEACRAIEQLPNGQFLVGAAKGFYLHDRMTNRSKHLDLQLANHQISISNIWEIITASDTNQIWFSKEEGGVYSLTWPEKIITRYGLNTNVSDRSLGLVLDKKQMLWVGTRSGITWLNTKTLEVDSLDELSSLFYDVNGYNWVTTDSVLFWLCSSHGLYLFDENRTLIRRYATDTEPFLFTNEVYDLIPDDGGYWIATDNGLHFLRGDSVSRFSVENGLPHNAIASVLLDDHNDLWLATFNGLSKRDKKSGRFQNFYVEDGLPHNEFNRLGKFKSKDGELFFSTQNGVVHFFPDSLEKNMVPIPLVLVDFSSFGNDGVLVKTPIADINDLDHLVIPAGNKYFQIDVALLNFVNARENRYAYFLEGLESDWRPLSAISTIQYNNLPPGTYTLHVRAASVSGMIAQSALSLRIDVLQHFYQTSSFLFLTILSLLALVSAIIRYRYLQDLKMERMRMQISSDLHDEVGGVLSGIAIQMEVLENRSPDDIKPFMKSLAHSSRNAVSKMRDVIWAVDTSKDAFEDLLERMKAFTLELLVPLDVNYNYTFTNIDKNKKLSVPFRQNVYLIFKEAMVNIIKHADAHTVDIVLTATRKSLQMRIADDGKGFSDASNARGRGVKNMQKRAKQIGGSLSFENGENGGTVLLLTAPF